MPDRKKTDNKAIASRVAAELDRIAHPEEHGTRPPLTECPDCSTWHELGTHDCKRTDERKDTR